MALCLFVSQCKLVDGAWGGGDVWMMLIILCRMCDSEASFLCVHYSLQYCDSKPVNRKKAWSSITQSILSGLYLHPCITVGGHGCRIKGIGGGRGCRRPLGDEIQQITAQEEGRTFEVDRNLYGQ
jgi:hypothetical protein